VFKAVAAVDEFFNPMVCMGASSFLKVCKTKASLRFLLCSFDFIIFSLTNSVVSNCASFVCVLVDCNSGQHSEAFAVVRHRRRLRFVFLRPKIGWRCTFDVDMNVAVEKFEDDEFMRTVGAPCRG